MLKWKSLTLSALVALAVTGAQGCIGVVTVEDGDGSGEGEGEGEGEEVTLLGVGEACNLTRTDEICDETQNLTCVQQGLNPNAGVCRPLCGSFDAQGQATKDPAVTCPSGTACQAIISADLTSGSVVCAPQGDLNEPCRGLGDPESCTQGDCVVLEFTVNDARTQIESVDTLACRESCDLNGAENSCTEDGHACIDVRVTLFDSDFVIETNAQGDEITCTKAPCDAGNPECECGEGFACDNFGTAAAPDFKCNQSVGMCAKPVPLIPPSQVFPAFNPSDDFICNEVERADYCDPRPFSSLPNGADVFCAGISRTSSDGVCAAFCFQGPFDYNGVNGIEPSEATPINLSCGPDYTCDIGFGSSFFGIAGSTPESCSQATCPAGQPCATCDNPQATCIQSQDGFVCAAQIGLCVAAPEPRCGDDVKNGTDQCDGADLGGATCPANTTGTVTCNAACELVTTGCAANPRCGDGVLNGNDECDGDDLGDATCPAGTSGTVSCNDDCEIVTTGCTPDPICGDDVKNGDDECDGDDLGGATCPTGTSGVVSCSVDCEIDETQCVPNCGNGRLDDGEACDGANIGTELCPLGTTGTPGCTESCAVDIGPPNCNPVLPDP
jgi:hypothetical protein